MPREPLGNGPRHIAGFWTDAKVTQLTDAIRKFMDDIEPLLLAQTGIRRALPCDELERALTSAVRRVQLAGVHYQPETT